MTADPVGAVLIFAAPFGIAGVFALALAERIVLVLPSTGLYVAIGGAAVDGAHCLPIIIAASILGSSAGAACTFEIGAAMVGPDPRRLRRVLRHRGRRGRMLRLAWRYATAIPFAAQLLPATRILAPLAGGALHRARGPFLIGTVTGLTLWNLIFITGGFVIARFGGPINATALGLAVSAVASALVAIALAAGLIGGRRRRPGTRRATPTPFVVPG